MKQLPRDCPGKLAYEIMKKLMSKQVAVTFVLKANRYDKKTMKLKPKFIELQNLLRCVKGRFLITAIKIDVL